MVEVAAYEMRPRAALLRAIDSIAADGLQHAEPACLVVGLHNGLGDQLIECLDKGHIVQVGDRGHCCEVDAPRENRECFPEVSLLGSAELIAPVDDRTERALTLHAIAGPFRRRAKRDDRRSRRSGTVIVRNRVAASSIASGNPSSERHTSAPHVDRHRTTARPPRPSVPGPRAARARRMAYRCRKRATREGPERPVLRQAPGVACSSRAPASAEGCQAARRRIAPRCRSGARSCRAR